MRGRTSRESPEDAPGGRNAFATTHWSVVLAAGADDAARARPALVALCRAYWYPLVTYVRRQGYGEPDAEDLVQGFFGRLLARNDLAAVRQDRGRFRSYLLGALKNFLVNDWKRMAAEKRGGGQVPIPLDDLIRARPEAGMAADRRSPDQAFDHQWAVALLNRVLAQLRAELVADGRERQYECL